MTTTQPKATLKSLDERQQKTDTALGGLTQTLRRVQWTADEAMRLAKGHVNGINKVHALERSLMTLQTRIDANNGQMTPAMEGEASRLSDRLSALETDLQTQLSDLRTQVEEHEATLGDHATQISMLNEGQSSLHERVTVMERISGFPKKAFTVALLIGAFAFLIWNLAGPFGTTIQSADGTETWMDYGFVNTIGGALLFGFLIFATIFGLSLFIKGKPKTAKRTEYQQVQTGESTARPIRIPIASRSGSDNQASTKVITTSGASSGTH